MKASVGMVSTEVRILVTYWEGQVGQVGQVRELRARRVTWGLLTSLRDVACSAAREGEPQPASQGWCEGLKR